MAGRFAELTSDDPLVIPIPLHRWRYWRRRFNQSAELARYLCHQRGTGVYSPVLLQHQRATQSQNGLSRQARKRNSAGAFAISLDAARAAAGWRT